MMRFDILIFEVDTLINISKTNNDIGALKLDGMEIKKNIRMCRSHVINLAHLSYQYVSGECLAHLELTFMQSFFSIKKSKTVDKMHSRTLLFPSLEYFEPSVCTSDIAYSYLLETPSNPTSFEVRILFVFVFQIKIYSWIWKKKESLRVRTSNMPMLC